MELVDFTRNLGYDVVQGGGSEVSTITANPVEKQGSIMVKLYSDAPEVYTQLKPYAGIPKEVLLPFSPQSRY